MLMICKTGLPSPMRQGLSSVSTMMLNGQAGVYGDAAVAAMSIVNRICMFVFSVGLGIGRGSSRCRRSIMEQKKYGRARKGFYFTITAGEVLLGAIAVLGMFFPAQLVAVFQNDPEVVAIGEVALRVQLVALFFQPMTVCANMMFQSIGKNGRATLLAMLRSGLCFIPVLLLLSNTMGLTGVEVSQTVADILSFFISLPFALHFLRELDQREKERPKI